MPYASQCSGCSQPGLVLMPPRQHCGCWAEGTSGCPRVGRRLLELRDAFCILRLGFSIQAAKQKSHYSPAQRQRPRPHPHAWLGAGAGWGSCGWEQREGVLDLGRWGG